jgi:hypothetical protein
MSTTNDVAVTENSGRNKQTNPVQLSQLPNNPPNFKVTKIPPSFMRLVSCKPYIYPHSLGSGRACAGIEHGAPAPGPAVASCINFQQTAHKFIPSTTITT